MNCLMSVNSVSTLGNAQAAASSCAMPAAGFNPPPAGAAESIDIDALLPQVYADLKRIAHQQLMRLRPGDSFSTTVLVHETYERLAAQAGLDIQSREHLLAFCARAMRHVLIDSARKRRAAKRGSGQVLLELQEHDLPAGNDADSLLALEQALQQLEAHDARLVRLVELRVFAGLKPVDIAQLMGVNERTVQRDWLRAKAWVGAALR